MTGTVLVLQEGDWRYGQGVLRLHVARVRWDLAGFYGNQWTWVEGWPVDVETWALGPVRQVLVRVRVLPPELQARRSIQQRHGHLKH